MEDWTALDKRHVWHPYTQMSTASPPLAVERAEGAYLVTRDGRRILDGISSWWVNLHGHSHPRLTAALERQARRLQQVIFAGAAHEPAARLAAELAKTAPPGLTRVFYSDDGSTAVEVALKLAAQYWRNRGEPQRDLFVALANAYHGDTFGAMAAGAGLVFHEAFRPFLFAVRRAHTPCCVRDAPGSSSAPCGAGCDGSLEDILEQEGARVAAVIVEPMLQGAGGMRVLPAAFLRRARELTRAHNTLLIADEVFTGFGRTGTLFACEHGPVAPDLLCVAKGLSGGYLPLAATLATEDVYAAFLGTDRRRTFFHGHSYTANALACAVALESLAIFSDEDVLTRVRAIESAFTARLGRLAALPCVRATRGIGAVAAVEISPRRGGETGYLDEIGPRLAAAFLARGILLRPLGNVLYVCPPYVINNAEIDAVFDAIEEVVPPIAAAAG